MLTVFGHGDWIYRSLLGRLTTHSSGIMVDRELVHLFGGVFTNILVVIRCDCGGYSWRGCAYRQDWWICVDSGLCRRGVCGSVDWSRHDQLGASGLFNI